MEILRENERLRADHEARNAAAAQQVQLPLSVYAMYKHVLSATT
jgi:hypothetical protein